MTTSIAYDGAIYWVVVNGERICGHPTYGQAERSFWLVVKS